jgi:TRAP-type uncharacterized transport system fused permease subunit
MLVSLAAAAAAVVVVAAAAAAVYFTSRTCSVAVAHKRRHATGLLQELLVLAALTNTIHTDCYFLILCQLASCFVLSNNK